MHSAEAKTPVARWIHAVTALGLLVGGYILSRLVPELFTGPVNSYATISGLVTLYGVLFAIVEVLRLESATAATSRAARRATEEVGKLYGTRALVECQGSIEGALVDIDAEDFVASSTLGRVTKLYSAIFVEEVSTPGSRHRADTLILESYASAFRRGNKTSTAKLRAALMRMMQDTSIAIGKTRVSEIDQ